MTQEEPPARRPFTLKPELLIAGTALMLSLVTVLVGAWFAMRGSVVTAVPPDSVFLYRDQGIGAVLTAGVDSALVNSASGNYGDVVTRVSMEVVEPGDAGNPSFDYETLVTPVFSENAERQAESCPITARCVRNGPFLAIEEPRRTLDVPGGSSRSEYIGFVLQSSNCARGASCDGFGDFLQAARRLEERPRLRVRFRYQLHGDGEKVAECDLDLTLGRAGPYRPWLSKHLESQGWVVLPCAR
jgi:hypothetical protein